METTSTFGRWSCEEKPIDFNTMISFFNSDDIFGKTIPSECTNVYLARKRRCKQRSDPSDYKVVSSSSLSHGRSMRTENTTSLTGSKAQKTEMYHGGCSKENHVDFYTKISYLSSDSIFGKTIPSECTNVYIARKRRCKQRSDPSDYKVVSASSLSHGRSMRTENTTSVLHVGLTGSKAQKTEMYHGGCSKENHVDFYTKISHLSSADGIFGNKIPLECPIVYVRRRRKHEQGSYLRDLEAISASFCSRKRLRRAPNATLVSPVGLMEHTRRTENIETTATHQRREEESVDFHTKISSPTSDGVSKERVPRRKNKKRSSRKASASSRRRSQRICKATSVLRQPLSNVLFDHCLRNIWRESPEEKRKHHTYLSSLWFYIYTEERNRERVLSWIKKENIFSKKYVFVPIVLWSHWSLLIICHLGESLESKTRTPCMLLLDSLHAHGAPPKLEPLIRSFVSDIYKTEDRPENKDMVQKIPYLVPEVPQQRNSEECGIFVLYYINLFLESAPESFSVTSGYPYFMKEDWFTEEALERFYDRLESLGLESSDSD